uniref:Uncharacterized protein n=2 Tax=Cajanus cajan TaxID=3821 RepID=A0A151U4V3_CAJCA|nr:hypothetical protein KK1_006966 [Cajanus cajan]
MELSRSSPIRSLKRKRLNPNSGSAECVSVTRQETMNKTVLPQSSSNKPKPPFKPAKDDTKPMLQDPILRSDPIETEEAVLRLPPFSIPTSTSPPQMS